MSIEQLPDELLYLIYLELDLPEDLQSLSQCSSKLHRAGTVDTVWKRVYYGHWKFHDKEFSSSFSKDFDTTIASEVERSWKKQVYNRMFLDRYAVNRVMDIVENPRERLKHVSKLTWHHMSVIDSIKKLRKGHGRIKKNYGIDYYCTLMEAHWSRLVGIEALSEVSEDCDSVSSDVMTKALQAISCFDQGTAFTLDMKGQLDGLALEVRLRAGTQWDLLPTRGIVGETSKVGLIVQAMSDHGITLAQAEDFYNVRNSFISVALTEGRATIPLTMVVIFAAIANRLGLGCYVIAPPGQVMARIEDGSNTFFVSLFEAGTCYSLSDLQRRFPSESQDFPPADVRSICGRVARNILNCVQRGVQPQMLDGIYAALTTLSVMSLPVPISSERFENLIAVQYPWDMVFLSEFDTFEHMCFDETWPSWSQEKCPRPKRRGEQPVPIRYRVGTIFRHALFNYDAVIIGWDHFCDQSPEWIRQMRVEMLQRGTRQPFYNVLCTDGSERYVAEDNILPITDNDGPVFGLLEELPLIGKFFRTSIEQKFVLSSDLKLEYPDDY